VSHFVPQVSHPTDLLYDMRSPEDKLQRKDVRPLSLSNILSGGEFTLQG
jgi:hypothetical protein